MRIYPFRLLRLHGLQIIHHAIPHGFACRSGALPTFVVISEIDYFDVLYLVRFNVVFTWFAMYRDIVHDERVPE